MTTDSAGLIPEWTRGDRLRKARHLTGMTTREFAVHIGVSQKTVTDAENDKRTAIRKILLNAWSLATGVPVVWLETGRTPHSPPEGDKLPRLDSNQQPFGYGLSLVRTTPHLSPVRSAA